MTQVIIMWMSKHDNTSVNSLGYNSGHGPTRVYEKDKYDPRLDLGRDRERNGPLPHFSKSREALAWMLGHRGEQCQVSLDAAKSFGFDAYELSSEVASYG